MMAYLRKRSLCFVISIALIAISVCLPHIAVAEAGGELTIYCFAAGKADAFLLTTRHGAVIIDCGLKGFGKEILSYLKAHDIKRVDYLIITHFDKDHVGGAAKVINSIPIDHVLQSDCPQDSKEYNNYIDALANASIEPVTVRADYSFTLDGAEFLVNPPMRERYETRDSNNSSLITTIVHGSNTFLFMGDAQTERLQEYVDAGCAHYDFLKVPHHGQKEKKKLQKLLFSEVSPDYVVITSSDETPEAETTVEALEAVNAEIFLTRIAPVIVRSNGATLTVQYDPVPGT